MEKATVLITGGTSGIGRATATLFAREGHRVYITARDAKNGRAVVQEIIAQTGNPQVRCIPGDLSAISSCKVLVDNIINEVSSLQILINNAGVFQTQKLLNTDGFETNFMVNYLAPFILSTGLVPLLVRHAPARILNVNTGLHLQGHFDLEKTPFGLDFGHRASYRNTKLANALFTVEMAERLQGTGITVNAFSPGLYNTNVLKVKGIEKILFKYGGVILELFQPITTSAEAPYYLATEPSLAEVTGTYFDQKKQAVMAEQATDRMLGKQLYNKTIDWIAAAS